MLFNTHYMNVQFFAHFVVLFFFVFGIVSLAVGVGLIVCSERMHRLFTIMNRWTSTSRAMNWATVPRDSEQGLHQHRHLFGAIFVSGGAFGLAVRPDVNGLVFVAGRDLPQPYVAWIADSVNWFLVAGYIVAIALGILFIFFPKALSTVEKYANRWYSFQQLGAKGDTMHLALDQWVERSPRAAGWIISAAALFVVVDYGIVLFGRV